MNRFIPAAAAALLLASCGGGGSSDVTPPQTIIPPVTTPPVATIAPSSQYAQSCAADNPYRADANSAPSAGSLSSEKQWVRSYFDEKYLWYDSVPTVDATAAAYSGSMAQLDSRNVPLPLANYFNALKTPLLAPSGALLDRFSFTYPTKAWDDLSNSGTTGGYGIEWATVNSKAPNRLWRVAIVQPHSPAAIAGIQRGDSLTTVDGVDFANGSDTVTINSGALPTAGATHSLVFSRAGSANFTTTLQASSVTIDPVPIATVLTDPSGRKVGYVHFTDHIASSEVKLINAVNTLRAGNAADLVLDMRYNGGGYLYIASELAYMIAGANRVSGKYFEKLQYSAKRTSDNAQAATPFYNYSTVNQALPSLNLARVFVIATADTCSASEAVINSLRGVDVEVQLIGGQTCGKPYGFTPKDNCGVSYFPIEFKGANYKGFGDYSEGFSVATTTTSSTSLPGCATTDDFDHALGDSSERMLNTALWRSAYGSCPSSLASAKHVALPTSRLLRSPAREGKVLLPSEGGR